MSVPLSHPLPTRLLYISSGGVREPLIQSQVLAYLKQLVSSLDSCHLLTIERAEFPETERLDIENKLASCGITWHPMIISNRIRAIGMLHEIRSGWRLSRHIVKKYRISLVHARSFVPGRIGLKLRKQFPLKFLYDMRGLWTLEKVAKGSIRNKLVVRIFQQLENELFERSDHIISLTESGKTYLQQHGFINPITVIPTCVDINRFPSVEIPQSDPPNKLIVVGSMGPGYLPNWLFRFYQGCLFEWPKLKLAIVTRSKHKHVMELASSLGCSHSQMEILSAQPSEIPALIAQADVGLCFTASQTALVANFPTKMGEYLAAGKPVVANAGIGDVDAILRTNHVGVILTGRDSGSIATAVSELKTLLRDANLSIRCRGVAQRRLSVEYGADKYREVYQKLLLSGKAVNGVTSFEYPSDKCPS